MRVCVFQHLQPPIYLNPTSNKILIKTNLAHLIYKVYSQVDIF
jgi:hypothetical protein